MLKIKIPDDPTHEDLIRFWLHYDRVQTRLELLLEQDASGERPCDGNIDKVLRWWMEWMRINTL